MTSKEKYLIKSWLVANLHKINTNYAAYVQIYNSHTGRIKLKNRKIKKITSNLINFVHHLLNLWVRRSELSHEHYYVQNSTHFQTIYRNYEIVREYCVQMKGFSNYIQNEADLMVGWKNNFVQFAKLWIIETQSYLQTGNNCIYALGADRTKYQKNTKGRCYDWRINIKKNIRKLLFEDCYDIDIAAAHPNIFYYDVLMGARNHPNMDMMIHQPAKFLNKITKSNIHHFEIKYSNETPQKKAKQFRSRLFYPMKDGQLKRLNRTGCKWYDDLGEFIFQVYKMRNIKNPEDILTGLERKYIDGFINKINKNDVLLLCHDGFINKTDIQTDINKWNQKNNIKFKQFKL